jgi:tryptophanyl-tRNA synthetase
MSRMRRSDPGNPEICNVFSFHNLYSPADCISTVDRECRRAGIGCVECKGKMVENLIAYLTPYREKRAYYLSHASRVDEILEEGISKAKVIAARTMDEVREAIRIK